MNEFRTKYGFSIKAGDRIRFRYNLRSKKISRRTIGDGNNGFRLSTLQRDYTFDLKNTTRGESWDIVEVIRKGTALFIRDSRSISDQVKEEVNEMVDAVKASRFTPKDILRNDQVWFRKNSLNDEPNTIGNGFSAPSFTNATAWDENFNDISDTAVKNDVSRWDVIKVIRNGITMFDRTKGENEIILDNKGESVTVTLPKAGEFNQTIIVKNRSSKQYKSTDWRSQLEKEIVK